jgi:hypothetical protein
MFACVRFGEIRTPSGSYCCLRTGTDPLVSTKGLTHLLKAASLLVTGNLGALPQEKLIKKVLTADDNG